MNFVRAINRATTRYRMPNIWGWKLILWNMMDFMNIYVILNLPRD